MNNNTPQISHQEIQQISPYKPGESIISGVKEPIKLSSNENPFGTSPKAIEAIQKAAKNAHRYPDGDCTLLRQVIGEHYGMNPEHIVCGAGSDELIALLCQAYAKSGDEVLCSEHGFLMYPISALRVGAKPVTAEEPNLVTDIDNMLRQVTEKTKIVFIANPNNPTGSYVNKAEMSRLRKALPSHVLLVIDEAYAEYVTVDDYAAGRSLVDGNANTVMTRTFSKIYGLGGLRLGWAYCPEAIADILNRIRPPFNVSQIAQEAGIAAIQDIEFVEKSRSHNEKWRAMVAAKMEGLGLKAYPSVANFILVKFPEDRKSAQEANAYLKSKGIIARAMESYGLPNCLRFTIGTEQENETLVRIIQEYME